MRWVVASFLLLFGACASPTPPATPALDVGPGPGRTSSPSVLERAQHGLLFADGGPEGSAAPAAHPHAGHHGHHDSAAVVDAGTP